MSNVKLKSIIKSYREQQVVKGIDFEINSGEFIVFVGPSGCGKSTTLRMIAGLEEISSGEIYIDDQLVNDLSPKDRNIAMVFQSYALYPHMTVFENMSFSLKLKKESKADLEQKVKKAAEILGLTELLERKPAQLSGGQRQRVAMGRAIVRNPKVFLFDEPLSNLDAKLRAEMRVEIKALHQRLKTTVIYVTHDQVEAMTLADRIVAMKDGEIMQAGTPDELFHQPANKFVAEFIGSPQMNMIQAEVKQKDNQVLARLSNEIEIDLDQDFEKEKSIFIGFRPDDFTIQKPLSDLKDYWQLSVKIEIIESLGNSMILYFHIEDSLVMALVSGDSASVQANSLANLWFRKKNLHFFSVKNSNRL